VPVMVNDFRLWGPVGLPRHERISSAHVMQFRGI
jgi:hypothetical protein